MRIKILLAFCVVLSFSHAVFSVFNSSEFKNKNYKQNCSARKQLKLKETVFPIKLGETTIKIVASKKPRTPSPNLYFNMHDNENTAVEAAKRIVGKFGGTLLELQSEGERAIKFSLNETQFTFDPNRIFTQIGIKKTLDYYGENSPEAQKEVERFANKLAKNYLRKLKIMIAVHNNTDEDYSIKSYEKGGEFETDAKLVYINPDADADDFFYVTDKKFFNFLKGKNYNVVLQDNEKVADDGSLAVYCGSRKIPYINVESEHNHLEEQEKMLEVLQSLLKKKRKSIRISK